MGVPFSAVTRTGHLEDVDLTPVAGQHPTVVYADGEIRLGTPTSTADTDVTYTNPDVGPVLRHRTTGTYWRLYVDGDPATLHIEPVELTTWAALTAAYQTWGDVTAAYQTWADIDTGA